MSSASLIAPTGRISVGVLGATGTVGQRFILLLAAHPYFTLSALGASARSAGKAYKDVVNWKQSTPIPAQIAQMQIHECTPEPFRDCKLVFSGLDADVAGDIELAFRAANIAVFSNAKNHRRDPICPLVVPLVNPTHLHIVPHQRKTIDLPKGFIVTNANCSTTAAVVPLAALQARFGPLDQIVCSTLQAISGAGYPGVSALDVSGNVVPYISGEEEKIEWETLRILGGISDDHTSFDHYAHTPIRVSATCSRVPVIDGHTVFLSVRFARRPAPPVSDIVEALRSYTSPMYDATATPSVPANPIIVHDAVDRPQPRLDADYMAGSVVHVGRIRPCAVGDVKMVIMGNNVLIGAATSSVMNAEIACAMGLVHTD